MSGWNAECHTGQSGSQKDLRDDDPPSFVPKQVYHRAPERFDDPGKVKPAGVERNFCVRQIQSFVHNDRDTHHRDVWQRLGDVECRNPFPWIVFGVFHDSWLLLVKFLDCGVRVIVLQNFLIVIFLFTHYGSTDLTHADTIGFIHIISCIALHLIRIGLHLF